MRASTVAKESQEASKKEGLSSPRAMAEYMISLKEQLVHPLQKEEIRNISWVMRSTSFNEVPFLLWALLTKNPHNLFLAHPYVGGFLVELANRKDPATQTYMATHRNTVDAIKFPVYAELIHRGAICFNPLRNRFDWA